jgi:hypothetical protein
MAFELETTTKAKITDVEILSQKNRAPDANPGAKLSISMDLSNDALSYFDGSLKGMLFHKSAASSKPEARQGTLDAVEPVSDLPNLTGIGAAVGSLHWALELTGYTLVLDYGMGGPRSNLELADCKLSGFKFTPKEGGTVTVQLVCETEDVAEKVFGKLATLKAREVSILLTAPEVVQSEMAEA